MSKISFTIGEYTSNSAETGDSTSISTDIGMITYDGFESRYPL